MQPHARFGKPKHRLRQTGRKIVSVGIALALLAGTFVSVSLATSGPQAQAAPTAGVPIPIGTLPKSFAEGPGKAYVSQGGGAKSLIHEVEVVGTGSSAGNMIFSDGFGPFSLYGLNALAYDQDSRLIYAMQLGSEYLFRIGDNGEYQRVTLKFPANSTAGRTWYAGTWGDGGYFMRDSRTGAIYKVTDLLADNPTVTKVAVKGTNNLADIRDFSYKGGYLWGFDASGGAAVYRVEVATGIVTRFKVPGIATTVADFGAQWFLGNGNLVVSKNGDGNELYYQLHNDGTLEAPVFTVFSKTLGTSSTNNDGASYLGVPIDLGVVKSASTLYTGNGTLTYSITVTNHDTKFPSSGHQLVDSLPTELLSPRLIDSPNCRIATGQMTCSGGPLAPGASVTYTVTGVTKGIVKDHCISNTARVVGNDSDPDETNNSSTALPCSIPAPEGYTVEKSATVDQTEGATADSTAPSGAVKYTITVTNTGLTPYAEPNPASFTDNLSAVLDDATFRVGSATAGAIFNPTTKELTWKGPLALNGSAVIEYWVDVNDSADTINDFMLTNVVKPGKEGRCESSCMTSTPVSSYIVSKSANKTEVNEGDTVTYTVSVTNIGQVDYTDATFADDLTKVTTNAKYNNDAVFVPEGIQTAADSGTLTVAGSSTLNWTGALAVDETKSFSYTVTVKDGASGKLVNVVEPKTYAGFCVTVASCTVVVPISGRTLGKVVDKATAAAGDVVTYTVTVANTGQTDLLASRFDDDLSAVLGNADFVAVTQPSIGTAAFDLDEKRVHWTGDLRVGQTTKVTYSVKVKPTLKAPFNLKNVVCWTDAPTVCADTTTKLPGRTLDKIVDKTTAASGDVVTYTVTVANTGETDLLGSKFNDDLAGVLGNAEFVSVAQPTIGAAVYDADAKKLNWAGDLLVGESTKVSYSVKVNPTLKAPFNLKNVVCWTDAPLICDSKTTKLPGRTLGKVVDKTTAASGDVVTYTVTVANTGETDLLGSKFNDDLAGVLGNAEFVSVAQPTIGAAVYDADAKKLHWIGDLLVGESTKVSYSVKVKPTLKAPFNLKNVVCWTDAPLICDSTTTKLPGRTLVKSVDKTTAGPGDTVTYQITVTNTGETDLLGSKFNDDLAGVLGNAEFVSVAQPTIGAAVYDADAKKLNWTGDLPVGRSATVTYSVKVNAEIAETFTLKNVVCWTDAPLICDSTTTSLPGRTLVKTVDKSKAAPGDTVTYTVTVTNRGQTDLLGSRFNDDLTGVLANASFDGTSVSSRGAATYSSKTKKLTWTGDLLIGQSATVSYSVKVKPALKAPFNLKNVVCWTDAPLICDSTTTKLSGRSLVKEVDKTQAAPGDTVTYTVTVTNTGETDLLGSRFNDDLTGVLGNAIFESVTQPTIGTATFDAAAKKVRWSGDLLVGESTKVSYSVKVKPALKAPFKLKNVVCWTDAPLVCADTTTKLPGHKITKSVDKSSAAPGETVTYTVTVQNTGELDLTGLTFADDMADVLDDATFTGTSISTVGAAAFDKATQKLNWAGDLKVGTSAVVTYSVVLNDPATGNHILNNSVCSTETMVNCKTTTKMPDSTLTKSVDKATAAPGESVTYTVTVTNTGQLKLKGLTFTDDMTDVLDDAGFDGTSMSSRGAAVFDPGAKKLVWTGDLEVGENAVVTYSVVVDNPNVGNHVMKNSACMTNTTLICGSTVTKLPKYIVTKTADKATAAPGDTITYTVTVKNTGQLDLTGLTFSDDMSGVLDDAAFDGVSTSTIGESRYDKKAQKLSWAGDLLVGESSVTTYSVVVDKPITGDHILNNVVCWTDSDLICAENDVTLDGYVVKKVADVTSVKPGDVVGYTITVTNTGTSALAGAAFTDDLRNVLKSANYNNDATGGATYADSTLSWSVPLAVGAKATVHYSVTVKATAAGTLKNVVVTPPFLSNCATTSTDPDCRVEVPVAPPLAETGVQLAGALTLALLTLGGGFALIAVRRRRKTETE